MSSFEFNEETANQAGGLSGFGGHRLTEAIEFAPAMETAGTPDPLAYLGIEDAEQVVAIAAISDVESEFRQVLAASGRDPEQVIESAKKALPADRLDLVNRSLPREFGLGVLPPTPEILQAAEMPPIVAFDEVAAALPSSINLISFMPPIRNQGPRGTCVSYSLTSLNEYLLRRAGVVVDLSEQHLYYEIKLIDGSPTGCGTWQVKAVNALAARGQCREPIWPYNPNPPCNNHGALPPPARPDGLAHRLAAVQVPARDVLAYKGHLAQERPVTLSIPVYNSWFQSPETKRSGRITMRIGNEGAAGGHAVCLVGYQDTPTSPGGGYFLVRNSWDTTWANQSPYGRGYGTIPYQYITDQAWEAFTAPATVQAAEEPIRPGNARVTIEVGSNIKIIVTGD